MKNHHSIICGTCLTLRRSSTTCAPSAKRHFRTPSVSTCSIVSIGEAIHPNPWYAIVNARDAEPTNYNGDARIDDLAKTTKMVVAWYKERAGIYTLEEALALKLTIIREFKLNK